MTLRRVPGTVGSVLKRALDNLTPAEVFDATGKKHDFFSKVSRETTNLSLAFSDAAKLDDALAAKGLPRLFDEHWNELRAVDIRNSEVDLEGGLRGLVIAVGDIHREADQALADDHLDPNERHRIAEAAETIRVEALGIRDAMTTHLKAVQ